MRLVLVVEASADADAASILADRVCIEGDADWIDAETLPTLRQWTGIKPGTGLARWAGLNTLATEHGIRSHGRRLGPDASATRKALLLVIRAHSEDCGIGAVVLVRDMDNQPERRTSMEGIRAELADRLPFQVVIAAPDPKREAWILHGYEPQNDRERDLLAGERARLGFDPITSPERLRGDGRRHADQEDRDIKRMVARLTEGDGGRERQCLEGTSLLVLRRRGQATGLSDYLGEVEERLVPLFDPSANTGAPRRR